MTLRMSIGAMLSCAGRGFRSYNTKKPGTALPSGSSATKRRSVLAVVHSNNHNDRSG